MKTSRRAPNKTKEGSRQKNKLLKIPVAMGNSQQKLSNNSDNPQEQVQEEEEEEEEATASTFTCEICIEPTSQKKKFKNGRSCVHPFCADCIAKYVHAKLEADSADIKCPGLSCDQLLQPLWCRPILPPSLFAKWCDRLCDRALLGLNMRYCPNRDCSVPVVNECGGVVRRSNCPNCREPFCFECGVPWHSGYGCSESGEVRDANDVIFGQLMERNRWSRCPGCGHCVERLQGCSTIECRCGTYFCYRCGEKIESYRCGCSWRERDGVSWMILSLNILLLIFLFYLTANYPPKH